jgi:hypothetical protein
MEIKLIIERLEGGRAFLRDERGRLIVWPGDFLPPSAKQGENISFEPGAGQASPKDILNEIFKT